MREPHTLADWLDALHASGWRASGRAGSGRGRGPRCGGTDRFHLRPGGRVGVLAHLPQRVHRSRSWPKPSTGPTGRWPKVPGRRWRPPQTAVTLDAALQHRRAKALTPCGRGWPPSPFLRTRRPRRCCGRTAVTSGGRARHGRRRFAGAHARTAAARCWRALPRWSHGVHPGGGSEGRQRPVTVYASRCASWSPARSNVIVAESPQAGSSPFGTSTFGAPQLQRIPGAPAVIVNGRALQRFRASVEARPHGSLAKVLRREPSVAKVRHCRRCPFPVGKAR